jgi:hypothetical protein
MNNAKDPQHRNSIKATINTRVGLRGRDPLQYNHPYDSMRRYAELLALRHDPYPGLVECQSRPACLPRWMKRKQPIPTSSFVCPSGQGIGSLCAQVWKVSYPLPNSPLVEWQGGRKYRLKAVNQGHRLFATAAQSKAAALIAQRATT